MTQRIIVEKGIQVDSRERREGEVRKREREKGKERRTRVEKMTVERETHMLKSV